MGKQLIETWFNERNNIFKKDTHYELNYAIKIIMNLTFGLLGSDYGPLLDQKAQLAVCINGILLITKMTELCFLNGVEVLYQNTDGFMIRCKKEELDKISNILFDFAKQINIPLEYEDVDTFYALDVNNYLLKTKKGKIKEKGCFTRYETIVSHSEYHKDTSMKIIAKALYEYFINGISIEETIYCSNNIFDFCIAAKGGSTFDLFINEMVDGESVSLDDIVDEMGELTSSFTFMEHIETDPNDYDPLSNNTELTGRYKFVFNKQEFDEKLKIIRNKIIDQRVIRYYISNQGVTLTKLWYENSVQGLKFTSLEANDPITIINKIGNPEFYPMKENNSVSFYYGKTGKKMCTHRYSDINREFYINKAKEIVSKIIDLDESDFEII